MNWTLGRTRPRALVVGTLAVVVAVGAATLTLVPALAGGPGAGTGGVRRAEGRRPCSGSSTPGWSTATTLRADPQQDFDESRSLDAGERPGVAHRRGRGRSGDGSGRHLVPRGRRADRHAAARRAPRTHPKHPRLGRQDSLGLGSGAIAAPCSVARDRRRGQPGVHRARGDPRDRVRCRPPAATSGA